MKRFGNMILRFSIFPVLVLVMLEVYIAVQKKYLLTETKIEKAFATSGNAYAWIATIPHPAKVLLLGSSSVKYGLSCSLLNKLSADSLSFVNLADEARDPVETYFILKQIDTRNVKAVYYALDPWIFGRSYYRNRSSYFYLDLDAKSAARYGSEHDPRFFPKRYKALFGTFNNTSGSSEKILTVPFDFGSASLTRIPVNFNDPVHKKFQTGKYGWSTLQFTYLQKIATLCESRNISFNAFYTPKRSDYIADYENHCSEIHAEFLSNLRATGFSSPIMGSFDQLKEHGDTLFADAYHLNRKGQEIYSKIFFSYFR